jgi:hypothetical protein
MKKDENKEVIVKEENAVSTNVEPIMGFEDEEDGDMIIPRVKIVQALSPERKEKVADEGDIINSLTKEKLNGKVFVPVWKYGSNIEWKDRSEGGGMACWSKDGKKGNTSDGSCKLCKACKRNEFDNSKQGKEAIPKCTKYINFFGFFVGERMPIILSFAKTNYNEGKKMFSLAKVTMQNMWNHGYKLDEKKIAKGGNEWYIINPTAAGKVDEEDKAFGLMLYQNYHGKDFNVAEEDNSSDYEVGASNEEMEKSEF